MKSNITYILSALLVFCSLIFLHISCKTQTKKKPKIAVTILPQKYFAEKLTKDNFEIFCVVPTGSSPESYDPSPSLVMQLGNSDAYMKIGTLGFELAWMDKIKHNNPQLKVFDLSESIDEIEGGHICLHQDSHTDCDHDHSEHIEDISTADPHYWSSPKEMRILLNNMYKAVVELDPENQEFYKNNLDSLLTEVNQVDSQITEILKNKTTDSFMIYHPALAYFARDYGLKQLSIEEGGKEPTPNHLKSLIDSARANNVSVIFVQKEFDTNNAKVIAQETGAQIIEIDPLNYNWQQEMIRIAKAFARE